MSGEGAATRPDIYIIGTGIQAADQMTRESLAALADSTEVFYVDPAIGTRAFLETQCSTVTSLYDESYTVDGQRLDGYRHMAIRVVEAALERAPVSFAMHGHPLVFCQAPRLISRMAEVLGLSVKILPGVSSMDCLFADLLIDPGESGLLMYEATDMLLRKRPLIPAVPTLIWQVGNLETRLHTRRLSRPERLRRFAAYLGSAYAVDHMLTAYYAAPHALAPTTIFSFPLGEIGQHAARLHPGVTLYLPPAQHLPVADHDLRGDMDDPDHLHKITL